MGFQADAHSQTRVTGFNQSEAVLPDVDRRRRLLQLEQSILQGSSSLLHDKDGEAKDP